ncbi:MAG: hypothetical protein QY311_00195 [Candidatus Paceibacterota bacterium]|nr:MAG: hypothetical protein QY311_00195 [Candidatus Paceibacterota bacterium]
METVDIRKEWGLVVLTLFVAGALWGTARMWLGPTAQTLSDPSLWAPVLLVGIVLAAVMSVAYLLVGDKWWRLGVSCAALAPLVLVLPVSEVYIAALCAALLILSLGAREVALHGDHGRGMGKIVTALFIAASLAYLMAPAVQDRANSGIVPDSAIGMIRKTVSAVIGSELDRLPFFQRKAVEEQIAEQTVATINTLSAPFAKYIPAVLTLTLFAVLISVKPIFTWLASTVAFFVLWLMQKMHIVEMRTEMVERQRFVLR